MNAQLVNYLVGIINTLTSEEKSFLQAKLTNQNVNVSSQECYQELLKLKAEIFNRRQGKPISIKPDDLLFELRNERDNDLISIELPSLNKNIN